MTSALATPLYNGYIENDKVEFCESKYYSTEDHDLQGVANVNSCLAGTLSVMDTLNSSIKCVAAGITGIINVANDLGTIAQLVYNEYDENIEDNLLSDITGNMSTNFIYLNEQFGGDKDNEISLTDKGFITITPSSLYDNSRECDSMFYPNKTKKKIHGKVTVKSKNPNNIEMLDYAEFNDNILLDVHVRKTVKLRGRVISPKRANKSLI